MLFTMRWGFQSPPLEAIGPPQSHNLKPFHCFQQDMYQSLNEITWAIPSLSVTCREKHCIILFESVPSLLQTHWQAHPNQIAWSDPLLSCGALSTPGAGEEVKKAVSYWCCSGSRKEEVWACGGHSRGTERVRYIPHSQWSVWKWNAELRKSWGYNSTMYKNKTIRSEPLGLCGTSIWTFQYIGRGNVGQHWL